MNIQPKSIIFDFGGVLLNLDLERSRQAFFNLGIPHFDRLYTFYQASSLFEELETGRLTPAAFFESLRKESDRPLSDEAITLAWNALLLDYRQESLAFVDRLGKRMPVFLYSNTNLIHYDCFQQRIRETTPYGHLNDLFEKAYYSHELGLRKPHVDGYLHILRENNLNPGETLFVDDNADNIEGAKQVGLLTHHLQPEESVEKVLAELLP